MVAATPFRTTLCAAAIAASLIVAPAFASDDKPKPTRDKRNVAIVVHDGVELLDFAGPGEVFASAAGGRAFRVYTVSESTKPISSEGFLTIMPEFTIANCPKPDIVVIPGGRTNVLLQSPEFMKWIQSVTPNTEIMFSVCTGAFVLADSGLLDGLEATTHHSSISGLKRHEKIKVRDDRRVVDNGKIVTSAGVSAGIDGALHLVARLCGNETAERTAKYMEYRWQPEVKAASAVTSDLIPAHAWFAENWADAVRGYQPIVAQNPGDAVAQYRLGFALARLQKDAEAVGPLTRSIELGRRDGDAYVQLALTQEKSKLFADAIKSFEAALAAGKRDWAAYFHLARCHARLTHVDDANANLELAYSVGMGSFGRPLADPDLASLHGNARFRVLIRTNAGSRAILTAVDEPGDALVVNGIVRDSDGKAIPDAIVYVYHTDQRGYYSSDKASRDEAPRLFGYLKTDSQGRYEFRTIRPGGYPDSKVPQHIHYEVTVSGRPKIITEFFFPDDPRLTAPDREKAAQEKMLATLGRDTDGTQRATFDIIVSR